jgi:uncharacterized protein YceH (UPF0502 family)
VDERGVVDTLERMIELTPDESRVLGVLIEKALTTPDQYPLTLNAVVNGSNQKNNRDPVLSIDDTRAFEALEGLRAKKLVVRADMAGSRVNKYRHLTGEALQARTAEVAILAELLLRGPQTLGELRGRASRMQPFESLDAVKNMLGALMTRDEPLVRELPPSPGSRAERWVQLLCPDLHPLDMPAADYSAGQTGSTLPATGGLSARVDALQSEVAILKDALRRLAASIGEPDPIPQSVPANAQGESD